VEASSRRLIDHPRVPIKRRADRLAASMSSPRQHLDREAISVAVVWMTRFE
jgi:predicted transcriptional regulator